MKPSRPRPTAPEPTASSSSTRSWDVCKLIAPDNDKPGIYGSDLGFSVAQPAAAGVPSAMTLLFGDTWAEPNDVCTYPVLRNDDLQATLPYARPAELRAGAPDQAAAAACGGLTYTMDSADPTSWRRMRLFPDALPRDETRMLDTSMLRTPAGGFSDGKTTFGIFIRHEPAVCTDSTLCPSGMTCSLDPSYNGKPLGACQPNIALTPDAPPTLCQPEAGCAEPRVCAPLPIGVCLAPKPFTVMRDGQPYAPDWYDVDPRRAVAQNMYIASAFWPDRPEDYATGARFTTNKFVNISARTVANFDPANPENNDYRPGNHTLLLWGRPSSVGERGFQALMFLLYQPLDGLLDASGAIRWAPKFFAGYGADGQVVWSDSEVDAVPVYGGTDPDAAPEFDYVNHMSVSYVDAMQRWVLFYGGSVPAWLSGDRATGQVLEPRHAQSVPGAMYLRSATHPWGQATTNAAPEQAWTPPTLLVARADVKDQLACDDDMPMANDCSVPSDAHRPADLLNALVGAGSPEALGGVGAACLAGTVALDTQYSLADDSAGHLYGVNILESWTADVTEQTDELPSGERAAEIYWNVSTWNPYQVILMKSQLRGDASKVY